MFKSLFSRLTLQTKEKRSEKLTLDFLVTQLTIPPLHQRHYIAAGNGRATSVTTVPRGLLISFERKITPADVKEGKLLPVVFQEVKRRGGKRYSALTLSLESAEDLHQLLGEVLGQECRRNTFDQLIKNVWMQMMALPFVSAASRP
jgi:hypothetical protein